MFRRLSQYLAPLTLLAAIGSYLHPPLFLIFRDWFLWLFAATMFALGMVLHPDEATSALKRPGQIVLGALTQYTLMPLLGYVAAHIAVWKGLSPSIALGFIIVASAPGAMASNVITYLAGGAVAYSIAVTTLSTMLSPLLTPLLVQRLGGTLLEIPFWPMMQTILLIVVLPLSLGMFARSRLAGWRDKIEAIAPGIAALSIIIICAYAVAANADRIAHLASWILILVIFLNGLGYICGWLAARMFRFDRRLRLTLAIEIGMQNAGLGVALALAHFKPETALPGALFAVWCILTAAGATRYLNREPVPVVAV